MIGLLPDSAEIKPVATPVMGAGILLGLLVVAMRLRVDTVAAAPANDPRG